MINDAPWVILPQITSILGTYYVWGFLLSFKNKNLSFGITLLVFLSKCSVFNGTSKGAKSVGREGWG